MTHLVSLIVVSAASMMVRSPPVPENPVGDKDAIRIAGAFLKAFERRDEKAVNSMFASEVVAHGFDLDTGSARRNCAAEFPGLKANRLGGVAATPEKRQAIMQCLLKDKLLGEGLAAGAADGALDHLQVVAVRGLSRRLRSYAGEVAKIQGGVIVQMPDSARNGVSLAVAVVLGRSGDAIVVRGFFVDPRFEE